MEKHLELIWKKIDNQLSEKEASLFDQLLQNDNAFVNLYNAQVKLNNNLRTLPSVKAPGNMVSNILEQITFSKVSYASKYSSFNGVKIIAWAFVALIFVTTLITLSFSFNFELEESFPAFCNWLSQISGPSIIDFNISSIYLLVILPILALTWMDNLYKQSSLLKVGRKV